MRTYIIDQHTVNVHDKGDKHRQKENLRKAAIKYWRSVDNGSI